VSKRDWSSDVCSSDYEETSKYGVIDPTSEVEEGIYAVNSFVEKPEPEDAPSNLAIIGRYLLKPEIFNILETQAPGRGGEVQLTEDRKSTRLNSSHVSISYAVF